MVADCMSWLRQQRMTSRVFAAPVHRDFALAVALAGEHSAGLLLEFGVASGGSIRQFANIVPSRTVHGFDSFHGLPEVWAGLDAGHFDQEGRLPDVPNNVQLHVGYF